MYRKYYNAVTEQGLADNPVWHHQLRLRVRSLRNHIQRMTDREWVDREMIMTVDELAGVAHIPNDEIETPKIDWRYTQRGDRIPADADRFDDAVESFEQSESADEQSIEG